jgi:putative transposase
LSNELTEERYAAMARYHAAKPAGTPAAILAETIESIAREGARKLLQQALEVEIDEHLGRARYAPGGRATGYRNGHGRAREVGVGTWSVEVRPPRLSDLPPGAPAFSSRILPRRRYLSRDTQRLFARLYLEGLSSGDFEPAFRELLGEKATLSPSTMLRLRADWQAEYETWRRRSIAGRYAYCWADGLYLGAGLEDERSCLLVVIGAREDGRKELLALGLGYRESTESWAGVLRDLRDRGLSAPLLAVGDGALGLWGALESVFPSTRHQRCWNHRTLNLLDRLPKRLWPETRRRLREVWGVPDRAACELRRDDLAIWFHAHGQDDAAETLLRDWDDFVAFYDFPSEHWVHLRTSNAIESVFSGVRLRTNVAKRARVRENALYLVWKIVERLSGSWRTLNGGATLIGLVLAQERFENGLHVKAKVA